METKTNFIDIYDINTDFDISCTDNFCLLERLGLSIKDVICLGGGIPCEGIKSVKVIIDTKPEGIIDFSFDCSHYELNRVIDFQSMIIHNTLMKVQDRRNGLGFYLLLNQIIAAIHYQFTRLELNAAGGSDWGFDSNWNGYYSWGRVGFLMDKESSDQFKGWVYDTNSGLNYLHEVLLEDWGKKVWKATGFSWDGYFDLKDGSLSFDILKQYLIERDIIKHL